MYLPSDTPLLQGQKDHAAKAQVCSDGRVREMRRTSAVGRANLFNTLVSPNQVTDTFGMGAGLDTAKLQAQTRISRGTAILGTKSGEVADSFSDIIANAPEVVSMHHGGSCALPSPVSSFEADPKPGMPQRAPTIVDSNVGPMYFRGADATFQNQYPTRTGLTGYAPPWSDAYVNENPVNIGGNDMGVASWLMDHPWLALALGAGAVVVFSRRTKR